MSNLIINDKPFRLYLSQSEIQSIVTRLADIISADYKDKNPILCPVLTGSYLFVADLSRKISVDCEVSFVRYSSYVGMHSSGVVNEVLPFPDSVKNRHVIIVEDIVDSGVTIDYMLQRLQTLQPASVAVCSFLFKPGNFVKNFPIKYIGASIPNDFVVGYGLDYAGKGRSYSDIYILDE